MDKLTEYILLKEEINKSSINQETGKCGMGCMKLTNYFKTLTNSMLLGPFGFIPFVIWISGKSGAGYLMCVAKCNTRRYQNLLKNEKDPKKRAKLQKRLQSAQKQYIDYQERLIKMLKKAKEKKNTKAIALINKYMNEIKRM